MSHHATRLFTLAVALPLLASCSGDATTSPTEPHVAFGRSPDVTRLSVPDENPNGPFYSMIGISPLTGDLRLPHTDEWGAVPLVRDISCIPQDFNLLSVFDFTPAFPGGPPRPFVCPSTLGGHLVIKDFGTPDQKLIQSQLHGLDEVTIVFASWADLSAAIADDVLTLPELLALPSAVIGAADFYKETVVTGSLEPRAVAFRLVARGTLPDGTSFRLQYVDQGPGGVEPSATQIVFR